MRNRVSGYSVFETLEVTANLGELSEPTGKNCVSREDPMFSGRKSRKGFHGGSVTFSVQFVLLS